MSGRRIEIVEVGPRDGLQNERAVLSVETRLEFIRRLEAAGAKRTEVASFVNPKRVPQMAGAEEIMAALSLLNAHGQITCTFVGSLVIFRLREALVDKKQVA